MVPMSDDTRPHRDDSETPAQTASREKVQEVTGHVEGIEQAANRGQLSRPNAERVIDAGRESPGEATTWLAGCIKKNDVAHPSRR